MTASSQSSAVSLIADPDARDNPKPRYDWTDPTVPIGNAPPMSPWRVYLLLALWAGWMVFLVAMAVAAHRTG